MTDEVHDNPRTHRFELDVDGATAFLEYRISGSVYTLVHTEVPKALSGHGIGTRLIKGALDLLRQSKARIIVKCPFVRAFLEKHPEFHDMVNERTGPSLDQRLDEALNETFPASDPTAVTPER